MPTIVITLSRGALPGLATRLRRSGLEVRRIPLLTFSPPSDWSPLDRALDRLGEFGAVALTSPRAARIVRNRLITHDAKRLGHLGTLPEAWVTSPATAHALHGVLPLRAAAGPGSDAYASPAARLAAAMLRHGVRPPVFFPCGSPRRDELPARLRAGGIAVAEVVVYQSVLAGADRAREACLAGEVIVVGSPRGARLLAEVVAQCKRRPVLIAIGPVTAREAAACGWPAAAVADAPTDEAVGRAILSRYSISAVHP